MQLKTGNDFKLIQIVDL